MWGSPLSETDLVNPVNPVHLSKNLFSGSTNDWHAIYADVENIKAAVNGIKSGDFIHYSVDDT